MDKLKAEGIPNRRPDWLASAIDGILNHLIFRLKSDKIVELETRVEEIKQVCKPLEGFKLSHTLLHGDYAEDNLGVFIRLKNRRDVAVFDWNTCYIGNPLYDLVRSSSPFTFGIFDKDVISWYSAK